MKFLVYLCVAMILLSACNENKGTGLSTSTSSSATVSTSTTTSSYSGVNAFQIIPKAGSTGSFNSASVPIAGGLAVSALRLFNIDGSQISSGNIPAWFSEAKVFLTSTNTSGGVPSFTTNNTACAYFDSYADYNPDTDGFYTIDGYSTSSTTPGDIDQCAGTAAPELNQLSFYVKIDRRFMNTTDKLQIIVKAKPIDAPNTAPTTSSCVVAGNFDPSNCVNQYFALTMRSAPYASAQPFYVLFPSAKSLDLLSESILLPVQIDPSITTISIDRVKGGAVFYGITVLRLL